MAGEIQLNSVSLATESGGTVTLNSSTDIKGCLNASGSAPIYACRAWVNFNGTGTVAMRDSGNVSSITDNGTGDYTVNFTAAMPDANYAVIGMTDRSNSGGASISIDTSNAPGTSSFKVHCFSDAGSQVDGQYVSVAVFR